MLTQHSPNRDQVVCYWSWSLSKHLSVDGEINKGILEAMEKLECVVIDNPYALIVASDKWYKFELKYINIYTEQIYFFLIKNVHIYRNQWMYGRS